MTPDSLEFPAVYFEGEAFILEPSTTLQGPSPGYFGGPTEVRITGAHNRSSKLHRVLTLQPAGFPSLEEYYLPDVPLFYGLRYCGCELSYRFPRASVCRIDKLEPRKRAAGWPYEGYPEMLPYIPLRVRKRFASSPEKFSALAWQGIEIKPKAMVVIVPPLPTAGVSLWGRSGDMEGVQMIFECDLERRTVKAYNQCS